MTIFGRLHWKYIKKNIRVAGIDMGTRTTCITITDHQYKCQPRIVYSEMFPVMISNMGENLRERADEFIAHLNYIIDTYNPDIISPELFFQRGHRSNLATPINYMIGVITGVARAKGITVKPIMPASWKYHVGKTIVKVEELYDLSYPIKQRLPNHFVDSFLISLFYNPRRYKCITKCQAIKQLQQLKGSTSVQSWLKQEEQRLKTKPKKKRRKKNSHVKK